jgi:predicted DNA-binding protein
MKKVETYLPETLVERLNAEAKETGIARSELIRNRLESPVGRSGFTTNDFHKAVTKIRRRLGYGLDRTQAESIVAAVFVELVGEQSSEQSS